MVWESFREGFLDFYLAVNGDLKDHSCGLNPNCGLEF